MSDEHANNPNKDQGASLDNEQVTTEKLNVIRIKRKRGEEPLNSLLVELPVPKKTYIDAFKDLSTKDKEPVKEEPKVFCLVGTVSSHDTPTRLKDKIKEAQQKRKLLLRTSQSADDKVLEHKETMSKQQKQARTQEIKLVRNSNKGLAEYSDLFHLVDLVKVEEVDPNKPPAVRPTPKPNVNNKNNFSEANDQLMCNYMPMVREYLNTNNIPSTTNNKKKTTITGEEGESDDEYVYDVYYADKDTATKDAKDSVVIARIETFDEELTEENEYDDGDTDSDDEENRVTDIYPEEDEDPEFEKEHGSSSDEYLDSDGEYHREAGYDRSESDDEGEYWG